MAERDLYVRTFVRASELLGSAQALADAIRVPMATLEAWLLGEAIAPPDHFHRAVEILLTNGESVPAPVAQDTAPPAEPEPPSDGTPH